MYPLKKLMSIFFIYDTEKGINVYINKLMSSNLNLFLSNINYAEPLRLKIR